MGFRGRARTKLLEPLCDDKISYKKKKKVRKSVIIGGGPSRMPSTTQLVKGTEGT